MGSPRTRSLGVAAALLLVAAPAWARPELSAAPHFLDLGEVQRVVFFAASALPGALATTLPDGSIEVTVPGVGVSGEIAGKTFAGTGDPGAGLSATVAAAGEGDARILIRAKQSGRRARAYAAGNPPRLIIDLSPGRGSAEAPSPAKPAAKESAPPVRPKALPKAAPTAPTDEAAVAAAPASPSSQAPSRGGAAKKSATAASAPKQDDLAGAAKAEEPAGAPKPLLVSTKAPSLALAAAGPAEASSAATRASAPSTRAPTAEPQAPAPATLAATTTTKTTAAAEQKPPSGTEAAGDVTKESGALSPPATRVAASPPDAPTQPAGPAAAPAGAEVPSLASAAVPPTRAEGPPRAVASCLWTRVEGLPFCAPDSDAPVYRAEPDLTAAAAGLRRGRLKPAEAALRAGSTGARRFLVADRLLLQHAADGWLLPAAEAYETALRAEPDFVDADRARVNLVLAYWAIGFLPELGHLAARQNSASPLADALLADLLLGEGRNAEMEQRLAAARRGGGLAACIASRVTADAALQAEQPERAGAALSEMRTLCPPEIFDDPASEQVRTGLRARAGDFEAAIARLEWLEREVMPRERARMLETIALIAERAGQMDRARRAYEQLASGKYGGAMERRGTVALASVDADQGRLTQGLERLQALSPDTQDQERRDLMAGVSAEVLREGAAATAVALLHAEDVDPGTLAADQQILLARRYREIGLPEHGARLLLNLRRSRPAEQQPVTLAAEIGENALARSDASTALAAAEEWRTRAANDPGALSLRLRAMAQLGADPATIDQAAEALERVDPVAAARIRVNLAGGKLAADPARARDLAGKAVAPAVRVKLAAVDAAAALWIHAEASERLGDDAAALAGFRAYVEEHPEAPAAPAGGYRLARVASRTGDAKAAAIGYAAAEKGGDPLTRRIAIAARTFHELVQPASAQEKP